MLFFGLVEQLWGIGFLLVHILQYVKYGADCRERNCVFLHDYLETTWTTGKNNFFFIAVQLRGIIKCGLFAHKPKSCFQKVVSYS